MPKTKKVTKKHPSKRSGALTTVEKELVARFVADQPTEVTPTQVTALAQVLRRSPEAVRTLVQTAKDNFVASAGDYVTMHKLATQGALATGDWGEATKASQWAITNISAEGERIIEKETVQQVMPRVMIGVKIGGLDIEGIKASDGVIVVEEPK